MMRLAEKAFYPAKIPFPVLQVDTGYDFPEVLRLPRQLGQPARRTPHRRQRRGGDRQRRRRRRRQDQPQPAADRHPAQRASRRRASPPPSVAAAATRRRPAPRSASTPTATSSASGTRRCSAPSCGASTTAASTRASTCGSSRCPTGPSSTSGTTSAARSIEIPVDLLLPPAPRLRARRHAAHRERAQPAPQAARTVEERTVRFRTVGDLTLTGCVGVRRRHHRRDHRRDRHRPGHRARRHPWRRPVLRGSHGRPQEGRLLLMASIDRLGHHPSMDLLRFATAGSVDDGKSTLIGRLLLDSKSIFEDQLEAVEATSAVQGLRLHRPRAAHRRPALRARAGHHHRRRLPLLRDARTASSSSPTPRATCSTPATWSPAPRPPTSAWCSSTPARA